MALNANFHSMVPAVLAPTSSAMKRVLARAAKELAQAQRQEEVDDPDIRSLSSGLRFGLGFSWGSGPPSL